MARHLIKPKYNQQENILKMIDEVVAYKSYGSIVKEYAGDLKK